MAKVHREKIGEYACKHGLMVQETECGRPQRRFVGTVAVAASWDSEWSAGRGPQGLPRRQGGVINLAARLAVWRLYGSAVGRISGKVSLTAARPNVCATVALNHCGKIICERSRRLIGRVDRERVAGRCEAAPRRCELAA